MKDEKDFQEAFEKEMNSFIESMNLAPREEFDNLSAEDLNAILYRPFEADCPIQYKESVSNETLEKIPFFQLFLILLEKIEQAGYLKLTNKGNLPTKLVKELYDTRLLPEEMIESGLVKLYKEEDSDVLAAFKNVAALSPVLKKRHNKLTFTQKGLKLYNAESRLPLFQTFFKTHLFGYNHGFRDGYPQKTGLQQTLGYTFYLLLRYGEVDRSLKFYVDKKLMAFPILLDDFEGGWSTPERSFSLCYKVRVFERFLAYYKFVDLGSEMLEVSMGDDLELSTTHLFLQVFEIRPELFKFKKAEHQA